MNSLATTLSLLKLKLELLKTVVQSFMSKSGSLHLFIFNLNPQLEIRQYATLLVVHSNFFGTDFLRDLVKFTVQLKNCLL